MRARELSAQHSRDSAHMKKFLKNATDFVAAGLKRHPKELKRMVQHHERP